MKSDNVLTRTSDHKFVIAPRLLAGLPMIGFGVLHFIKPDGFHDILVASGIPMPDLNVYAAPIALVIGGVLLALGFIARVGGVLGIATMSVAVYSTVVLSGMTAENLPGGLTEVPRVPPLPLPVVVIVASLLVVIFGGGCWSLDRRAQLKHGTSG